MAMEITVRDTSIYDCARAGINIGDGCWGGHVIERCDVFDTVLETHDHGSFNSWGRDRYWRSDHLSASQAAVDAEPTLPFLDAVKTTVIRDSRWRCDHGWDIDLDDGSSNYDIYNNLLLNGGLKLREGFRRRAWNNISVNSGLHPHVWFNHSQDEVFSNIFAGSHRGARMPSQIAKGKRVDSNLFFGVSSAEIDRFAQFAWDVNSIVADPLFVDPAKGDFRVKEGSPAFGIGFKNFPMNQFGVKKPSLKAIARTPIIPELGSSNEGGAYSNAPAKMRAFKPEVSYWLGARLHTVKGEEFSAYGVGKEEGGVALAEVPKASAAARAGLRENDLVQVVNEHPVSNAGQLFKTLAEIGAAPLNVSVVRNQQVTVLAISEGPYIDLETSDTANGFRQLPLPSSPSASLTANQQTANQPLKTLVDGRLTQDYGPVFRNGIRTGAYKMDLGATRPITAISSWSFNKNGNRGAQKVTLYGSSSATDPGWDLADRAHFTPLGSIDTTGVASGAFNAASLRARTGQSLGEFRWIVWSVSPVTTADENTSFQELAVDVAE